METNAEYSEIVKTIEAKKITKTKNKFYKFMTLLMAVLFMVLSCGKKQDETEYEVTTVQTGDLSLSVSKTGQVVSDNEVSVYTTSSQRVSKVYFKKGDNVKKGEVVVRFYPIDRFASGLINWSLVAGRPATAAVRARRWNRPATRE